MRPRRGEIWFVDLDPVRAGEVGKMRPCVIVSNDGFNDHAPAILVMPISSYQPTEVSPVVYASAATGLRVDSSIITVQIRAVVRSRFDRCLGRVPIATVEQCIDILNAVLV